MIESNLVNLKQGIGLLGSSEKLQERKTGLPVRRQTGKEPEQMMPFFCMMGQICRITTQETEKTNQSLPVKGRGPEVGGQRSEVRGQRSELARRQSGGVGGQPPAHRGLRPGGRAEMVDAPGLLKFSLKNAVVVKAKSSVEPDSGGKNGIGNSLKPLALKGEAKAVVGKNEAQVRVGADALIGPFGKRALDSGIMNGKTDAALFKNGKNIAGINNALLRPDRRQSGGGHRTEGNGRKAKMEEKQGLLKFSLKNAVVVKAKSSVEPDSGGKNGIGNSLKPLALKGEEAMGILHRGTSPPERPSYRDFSAGGYQHTAFHADSGSAVINESVNSYDVEPRALINQIANSVKKPGRVRITLNPPRLGTLDVDVLVRDNKVHVILQTENNDVRQILQSNVESLKSSLRNHGLVADTINVSVQEKPDGGNYGSGRNETLFREGRNREGNEEDHGGEQDSLNHDPSSFKEENPSVRSDGRVSLFA